MAKLLGLDREGGPQATAAVPLNHTGIKRTNQALTLAPKPLLHPQAPTSYIFYDHTGNGATMSNVVRTYVLTSDATHG
jgi:hypothetical protein